MNLDDLKKPLPKIHWRAQMVSKNNPDNPKAMALAYMDARDVMDRLDAVCGPHNWQDSYVESAKGRVICTISILVGDQWVSKSDGAGDTAVEREKGGISDAFKRDTGPKQQECYSDNVHSTSPIEMVVFAIAA